MHKNLLSTLLLSSCLAVGQAVQPKDVILDTDIVGDIDDTWALGMLVNSPELNLKLVSTATGNPLLRAKCVAKMLTRFRYAPKLAPRTPKCSRAARSCSGEAPWA